MNSFISLIAVSCSRRAKAAYVRLDGSVPQKWRHGKTGARARRALLEGIARNAHDTARIGEFHFARFPIATDIGILGACGLTDAYNVVTPKVMLKELQ